MAEHLDELEKLQRQLKELRLNQAELNNELNAKADDIEKLKERFVIS